MADLDSRGSCLDYLDDDENEFPSSSMALQIARTPENDDLFRPSLADEQKIGFFSLDRATQTEDTEIIDMKQMTDSVHQLLEDADQMKRDINFAKNVMQADFDAKLQQKAIELYVRVNDKISDIEKMQEERVATVRRAFKQQLADALVRMHTLYNKDLDRRMHREKHRKDREAGKWEKKVRDLQATIQRNEAMIHMLKEQIAEYQEREDTIIMPDEEELEVEEEEVEMLESKTPSFHIDETQLNELREEIAELEKKNRQLEDAVDAKDETTKDLNKEIENLQDQLERERIMIEQFKLERNEMLEAADHDKASVDRQMEREKLAMQKSLEERIRQAREEAYEEARQQMAELQGSDRERMNQLMEEKKMVEQLLAMERAKKAEKTQEAMDLEKAMRNEQRMMAEINKLKKEIERVHRSWEKKFAILQQSLHALKDESYLRQTMQRQAAQLHQASISFAYEAPSGNTPAVQKQGLTGKKALPDIARHGRARSPTDYMSYTVSAPSGRATTVFTTEENQIMSDTEQDMPADVVPLPPPPHRAPTDCREDSRQGPGSRASSRSHVVVLPSVQAQ